jgi:hypothetical protein
MSQREPLILIAWVIDLYYLRVYLRSPSTPNSTFASRSTASLGEVLFIWFLFVLIWLILGLSPIRAVRANGFRSLAAQPRVWGKFCLFGFCLFSFGSY